MLFKNYRGSFGWWWTWAYISLIFIKVQELQIVLKTTQTPDVLVFFKEKFCLMSRLKFILSDVTLFLPDILSKLIRIILWPEAITWTDPMVFTTEKFLEIAIESWFEWDLNPRPLNSVQKLKPAELSGHYINTYI